MNEDQFYEFLESASSIAEPDYGAPEAKGKAQGGAKRKPDADEDAFAKRAKPAAAAPAQAAKPGIHQSRPREKAGPAATDVLWVDKYKPASLKVRK
jgi:hypothetical protein